MPMRQDPELSFETRLTIGRSSPARAVALVGGWAALLTAASILLFDVAVALGVSGFGVGKLPVAAALLIAPSYLAFASALHRDLPEGDRIWSQMALAFAVVYAAIVGINYALQLTVVPINPEAFQGWTQELRPDSAFWALEIAGYAFMGLSALALVPALSGTGLERAAGWLFVVNGIGSLIGGAAYLITMDPAHWLGLTSLAVWGAAFPVATALIGWQWFRRLA